MEYIKFNEFIDSVQYGYTANTTDKYGNYKYLRITDIVPYFVDKERVPFVNIDEKKSRKYIVYKDDLLIARTGATTGYNLVVPGGYDNFIFASYLVRYYYDKKRLYPLYLKYVLKSRQWYGFINNYIGGSAQPGMNPRTMGKFQLPYHTYSIQEKIASVLNKYDQLIENNNKRIKILEEMAELLYKEWFVRFRFPGYETVEFKNGIPKGWKIGNLLQIITLNDSKRKPLSSLERDCMQKNYPYYGAAELMDYVDNYIFDGKYLLMGEDGSVITNDGYSVLQYIKGKFWVNNHAHVISGSEKYPLNFIYCLLKKLSVIDIVTGAAQPKISQGRMSRKKIIIPSEDIIKKFCNIVDGIFEEEFYLKDLNEILTQQRDVLLPRLMSGKLEV